jgi:hypothetical protein
MTATTSPLDEIPGLLRCETTEREVGIAQAMEMTHSVYTHEQIYGQFCTLQDYIDVPPHELWDYLADDRNLDEWTYSTRHFEQVEGAEPGLKVGWDRLADDTRIYLRVEGNREALTLDYRCAWDQGEKLWMNYMMRILPADIVLDRPGSVLVWTNCRHPWYDDNPHPELASSPDRVWVGDLWPLFYAGHAIELANLKAIMEHRHRNGIPLSGHVVRGR